MYHSKKNVFVHRLGAGKSRRAFMLVEVIAAIFVLALIVGTILTTMNRCISSTIDIRAKMRAFELARENMETLLAEESVSDTADYGIDPENPDIEWEIIVEPFYEPASSQMWIKAVCSAWYTDTGNERQMVELTHWLTKVTEKQQKQILDQQQREQEYLDAFELNDDQFDDTNKDDDIDADNGIDKDDGIDEDDGTGELKLPDKWDSWSEEQKKIWRSIAGSEKGGQE